MTMTTPEETIRAALRVAPVVWPIARRDAYTLCCPNESQGWRYHGPGRYAVIDETKRNAENAMVAAWVEWLVRGGHLHSINFDEGDGWVVLYHAHPPVDACEKPLGVFAPTFLHALAEAVVAVGDGKEGT